MADFDRITHNPAVMVGKACIRGMRVTVEMIVGQLGTGTTVDELLEAYPYLEREDVIQALRYAAWMASGREVELAEACSPPSWRAETAGWPFHSVACDKCDHDPRSAGFTVG
jgi:uncharacterized protein (DUF433 family)